MYATHHIAGIQPGKGLIRFSLGPDVVRPESGLNIWSMQQRFPYLNLYLDLWGRSLDQTTRGRPEGQTVRSVLNALKQGQAVERKTLLQTMHTLLRFAPGSCIREMQGLVNAFSGELPKQYEKILRKIDLSLNSRDELLLSACSPDIYVWIPHHSPTPKRLLICFGTKSNTLNMPTAMAHYELSRLGIAIMYIGNRPNIDPAEGLPGLSLDASAKLIGQIARDFGFDELYGLGTSLGGYVVCRYASALGLKRVINFSGYPGKYNQRKDSGFSSQKMAFNYPLDNILTVLSNTDEMDQRIRQEYDIAGFVTDRVWVDSPTHGSFSSAFLEDKLDDCLAWLFAGDDGLKAI